MKQRHTLLLVLVAAIACLPALPAAAATAANSAPVLVAETGHTLGYAFRVFFERQGGLPVIGLPLTEVFLEDGRPVQYFERARLEWHAETGTVEAGHLGRWAAERSSEQAAFVPINGPTDGGSFFPETGHTLGGAFLLFWQRNGGIATFGYPLSEPFEETNASDGQTYTVQYLERARFELHPELPAPAQVLLGHLGRQYLAEHPAPAWASAQAQSAQQAWDGVRPTHLSLPRIGVDVDVIEATFGPLESDVPRYAAGHFWEFGAQPGTPGNIIIAGHVGYRGIIFNKLPNVQVGDEALLQVGGQQRRYRVREVLTVLPDAVWVLDQTPQETLTLITCVPIGIYTHRLIVRAVPEE